MIGTLYKTVFRAMRHILSFGDICLLANYAIVLYTVMLGRLFPLLFELNTSPIIVLTHKPNILISVRMRGRYRSCNLLDFGNCPFPIIFDLNVIQEVTPIFMSQGTIVLLVILQLILHG